MSYLRKLCDCSKSPNKKAAHLIVPFKSYKVNPNASLIRGMKVWQMCLQIETPTRVLFRIADTSCDAKRNLNRQLWHFFANPRFLDSLMQICSTTMTTFAILELNSLAHLSSWDLWLSIAKDTVKLCGVSGEICMICLRFCISLAMIQFQNRHLWMASKKTVITFSALVCLFSKLVQIDPYEM